MEEIFVRRLKKGIEKYRVKLPFKCFNFGKIGHYASKCPIKVANDKPKDHKGKFVKKIYCVEKYIGVFADGKSNYFGEDSDECVVMTLKFGYNSINSERCVNESAMKIGHNIEGTIVTAFHAREERNYWIIDIGSAQII